MIWVHQIKEYGSGTLGLDCGGLKALDLARLVLSMYSRDHHFCSKILGSVVFEMRLRLVFVVALSGGA